MLSKWLKITMVGWLLALALPAGAQGTAFVYQGQLSTGGSPTTGNYDFRFAVYDAVTNGNLISPILTNTPVGVTNGLFATAMDFGTNIFTGPPRWLDIGVRTNLSTNSYTDLLPRQALTATPYAIFAGSASNLVGTVAAAQITGTLDSSQITGSYTGAVSFTSISNAFAGAFTGTYSGNGLGLTNLNGSMISTGTVADVRLSTNVAFLNGNQTFSGANTLSNWNNSFTGSFYGNGLVGWNTVAGNSLNAVLDHGYVLTSLQLTSVLLPTLTATNVGAIIRIAGAGTGGWKVQCANGQSIVGNFYSYGSTLWNLAGSGAPLGNWQSIASSADGSRLVAAFYAGDLYTSDNYGVSWSASGSVANWHAVAASSDGTRLVAAVYGGGIYTNHGTAWAEATGAPNASNWVSVASSANGSFLAAAVSGGDIYLSSNYGSTWTAQTGLGKGTWQSVACSANGTNLVAALYGGSLYYSLNAGASWANSGVNSANWASVACSANGSNFLAGAYGGGIYLSTNSGVSWQSVGPATTNWYAVASSADGNKLGAVVYGGQIYLSNNQGATWQAQTEAPATNWCSIAMSADGSHIAAAASGATPAGLIEVSQTVAPSTTTTSVNGSLSGNQGSSVELQYIGNNQYMPVSSAGQIWSY